MDKKKELYHYLEELESRLEDDAHDCQGCLKDYKAFKKWLKDLKDNYRLIPKPDKDKSLEELPNIEEVLRVYTLVKNYKYSTNNKALDEMYGIVTNRHYSIEFTKEERLIALECMREIINRENKNE
ncbi:MAG: hypothetical protein K9K32_00165 [Halanaerobiales bacterium]|nr:hypothetical protein [Halanaerobiales bacterium]